MPKTHPRDMCKCGQSKLVKSQTCAACRPNTGLKKPLYDACQSALEDGAICGNQKSVKAKQCMECYADQRRKPPEEPKLGRPNGAVWQEHAWNQLLRMPLHARS